MAQIAVLNRKCDGCGACVAACPFGGIELIGGAASLTASCRACGVCVKTCAKGALIRLESKKAGADKSKWTDLLVYAEQAGGRLHPVTLELIGEALRLANGKRAVDAVLLGADADGCAEELLHFGVRRVYLYDDPALAFFRADVFADCVADAIAAVKPSVVLVGATALGRSLAPRLSTRFRTGLTADCTRLEMRESSDLVQIRPAFGGNIMAQIVTPDTRPQFATVRYKVMDAPTRMDQPAGEITRRALPRLRSAVTHISTTPIPKAANISDAEVIVAAGRGLKKESDMAMVRALAQLLGGEYAVSRPLAEKGWESNLRQIGLSGRTVRPKLILTFGISGAIQFASCMNASDHIVAVNSDPDAPIFKVAHVAIVADLYDVLPRMMKRLKEAKA